MRTSRSSFAAALLVLAAGLSGCGGDTDDAGAESTTAEPTVDPTPEGEDFVAEGNAVCQAAYPDINAVAATIDPTDGVAVTETFLPLVQALQDDLAALTVPDDLAAGFGEAMAAQQAQLDVIIADPAALVEVDSTESNAAFDSIGLDTCGSGSADVLPSRAAGASAG